MVQFDRRRSAGSRSLRGLFEVQKKVLRLSLGAILVEAGRKMDAVLAMQDRLEHTLQGRSPTR